MKHPSFDSVLVISFGGPQGPDDIRPFLANVLRGRRVSPERVEEVAHHYELFGGVSPITAITRLQAEGLRVRLAAAGHPLPVYVGMRNWHPLLPDTLRDLRAAGLRRAVGFIASAQHSYSSCQQYRENVAAARTELRRDGDDVEVTFVGSWFDHPLFIAANAAHVREAIARLPEHVRSTARLVCTAHSIPAPMAAASRYEEQLRRVRATGRRSSRHARLGGGVSEPQRHGPAIPGSSPTSATTCDASGRRDSKRRWSARSDSCATTSRCCTTSIAKRPT